VLRRIVLMTVSMTSGNDSGSFFLGFVDATSLVLSTAHGGPPTKPSPPGLKRATRSAISHAMALDFPRICGCNHTENSQVGAADEILGTNRFDVPFI
jgi:hypothetical protein